MTTDLPWGAPAPESPPSPPFGPPPAVDDEPRKKIPLWTKIFCVVSALVAVAILVGFVVHVPYSTISPGATVKLTDQIAISGAKTYPTPRGDIRLLFVRERNHINLWQYLAAQFQSDTEVIKEKEITGGKSPQQLQQEAQDDMTRAKKNATTLALTAAGYTPTQIIVKGLSKGAPAEKVLKVGDTLLAADGRTLRTDEDLRGAIARHEPGETVSLTLKRNGNAIEVKVPVARSGSRKIIGVELDDRFSIPITIDTSGIGGPSGGLAMTLAIYDDLTPGDLTGSKRVAVTGEILEDGTVGIIGGIEQKAVTAKNAGARLFLVPACNPQLYPQAVVATCNDELARVKKRAGSKVKVVPVSTFQEALQVLRDNGGAAPS